MCLVRLSGCLPILIRNLEGPVVLTAVYTAFALMVQAHWAGYQVRLFIGFTDWPFPLGTYQTAGIEVAIGVQSTRGSLILTARSR
jgi:hypothetical protein